MVLAAMLCCVLAALSGCAVVDLQGEMISAEPNLSLLRMEPYEEADEAAEAQANERYGLPYQVDLWLDGSQLMGGVNPNTSNVYPHFGRQYREGGFHYRFNETVGWYHRVLTSMLDAAEGSWVRVLRFGNERLPDSLLQAEGLASRDAAPAALRSLRRDLLTYAVRPLRSVFEGMAAEDMKNSFYSLGSVQMNQMGRFAADRETELENPALAPQMDTLLNDVIRRLADKAGPDPDLLALQSREEEDYPLLYALENIDMTRLSVITFDPAGIRRLSHMSTDGSMNFYVERLLTERGLFDKGLSVGLYAFRLDYIGQMATIGLANLSEPFIWGKLDYGSARPPSQYAMPMPRMAMALVIGPEELVRAYMDRLNGLLEEIGMIQNAGGETEKEKRGPHGGELAYSRNGVLTVQEPFTFEHWNTLIVRPNGGNYRRRTPGAALTVEEGEGRVEERNGLQTVFLRPMENGLHENRVLRLSFPRQNENQGVEPDLSKLEGARVEVTSAILLAETLPNRPSVTREPAEGEQILALRDKLYVYARRDNLFHPGGKASPFTMKAVEISGDGREVVCTLEVEGVTLEEGYYRLEVRADLPGSGVEWAPVNWIDGSNSQAAPLPDPNDVVHWEAFTAEMARNEKSKTSIIPELIHAWGTRTPRGYSVSVPDSPQVDRAMGLVELTTQIRNAATRDEDVFIRYVFDVFADNRGAVSPPPVR